MIVVAGVTNLQFSVPVDGFPVAYVPVRYPQGQTGVRVAGVGYNVAAALAAPTIDERIRLLADGSAALMARAGDVFAVAQQAEPAEPGIADAARAGRAATRDSLRRFFTQMRDDGLLPADADLDWLCDTAGVLGHANTYLLIRETLGWTTSQYRTWLGTTWERLITAATRPDAPAA